MFNPDKHYAFLLSANPVTEETAGIRAVMDRKIEAHLTDFYSQLGKIEAVSHLFSGDAKVPGLKKAQKRHWQAVFGEKFTDEIAMRATQIGHVHSDIGLDTSWYFAAYGWLMTRMTGDLIRQYRFRPGKLDAAITTLIRRVFIDMISATTAYDTRSAGHDHLVQAQEEGVRHLRNLSGTVADVNAITMDVSQLSANTRDMNFNAQKIAAAVHELVASIENIANSSESAASQASQTDEVAVNGRGAVGQVSEAIGNIAHAVEETAASVDELARASEQIGQILSVIENIAQQTNLLALNATIEAARAGEAGRGFGVVANEVKGLAGQTARATEDIASRIASLRGGMTTIIKTMERSKTAVLDGQRAIGLASDTMQQIAGQVGEVSEAMQDISGILVQQKQASAEIARNVESVATSSDRNEKLLADASRKLHDSNTRLAEDAKQWFADGNPRSLCEMAKIDHILFKKRVVDAVMGFGTWKAGEVPDHHACRLGKWYDTMDIPGLRSQPEFERLLGPHEKVHASARAALEAHERGDSTATFDALGVLSRASDEVIALLDSLSRALDDGADRRSNSRYDGAGSLAAEVDNRRFSAEIFDVSRSGIGVHGLTKKDVGKSIKLRNDDCCLSGTAVWSDGKAGGIELDQPIPGRQMQKFVATKVEGQ